MTEKYTAGLDWLRFSMSKQRTTLSLFQRVFEGQAAGALGEELKPFTHYDRAYDLSPGRVDLSDRPEQGGLFTFTGRALGEWRDAGRSERELLAFAVRNARNITRIDFALDVRVAGADARDIWRAWREGKAKTRAKTASELSSARHGQRDGYTCYIGSRSSARLLRAYDKAAERRRGGEWVRVELECKSPHAQLLAHAMLRTSIADAGRAAIRDFFDAPEVGWWRDALAGPAVGLLTTGRRKQTSFEKWLQQTVLPVLAREVRAGNWALIRELRKIVALADGE